MRSTLTRVVAIMAATLALVSCGGGDSAPTLDRQVAMDTIRRVVSENTGDPSSTAPVPGPDPVPVVAAPARPAPDTSPEAPTVEPVVPDRVFLPTIELDTDLIPLWLREDGTLDVPEDPFQAGWWAGGSALDVLGPTVVVGHVDSTTGPAIFYDLRRLQVGDPVAVGGEDGKLRWFVVTELEWVDKDEFPTERVYGIGDTASLRLITCGGPYDREVRSYEQNLIVYAEPTDRPVQLELPQSGS